MATSTSRVRIGFIGAGGNTRARHIPEFQKIPGVECHVVVNRSEQSSRKVADEFGIPNIAADWKAVLADPEVDAISIGTWPYTHAEMTIAALEAGKHVLTEARMAAHLSEAEAMADCAAKHPDLVAQIVPAPMSLTIDPAVFALIESGKLGAIRSIQVQHLTGNLASPEAPLGWRSDFNYSGINILSLGILHEIVSRWMPEDPREISARAEFVTRERKHFETGKMTRVEVPDTIAVWGKYPSGATLNYLVSGAWSGPTRGEIRIEAEGGGLRFEIGSGNAFFSPKGSTEETQLPRTPPVGDGWQVEAEFVQSIREGKPVLRTDFTTGLRYMRFLQEVYFAQRREGTK